MRRNAPLEAVRPYQAPARAHTKLVLSRLCAAGGCPACASATAHVVCFEGLSMTPRRLTNIMYLSQASLAVGDPCVLCIYIQHTTWTECHSA